MVTEYTLKKPLEIKCFSKAIAIQKAENDPEDNQYQAMSQQQTNTANLAEIDESFEQELDRFSKRLEEQFKTISPSRETTSTGIGRVSQSSLSPQTQLVKSARRKLVPNVTQTWVGKVRQRLNYAFNANSCGNYRTHRPMYGGENLTVVEGKQINSAREPSVTTQSTATNGVDRSGRGFQTHADYQKAGYDIDQNDSMDVTIGNQQRSA